MPLSPEIIEKAARAIHDSWERAQYPDESRRVPWEAIGPVAEAEYLSQARAALDAAGFEVLASASVEFMQETDKLLAAMDELTDAANSVCALALVGQLPVTPEIERLSRTLTGLSVAEVRQLAIGRKRALSKVAASAN